MDNYPTSWILSVSYPSPHIQLLLESLCIQNKVKPVLVKLPKAASFQLKATFNIIAEYLTASFPSCNQPIITSTPVCAKMEKSIRSIIIPIITSRTTHKVFFRVLFILFFRNTELLQVIWSHRQQTQLFGQSAQICVPHLHIPGILRFCTVEPKGIEPIAWSRAAVANFRDKLYIVLWKLEVIFFLYRTNKCYSILLSCSPVYAFDMWNLS